jgi:competence protein ComEC
VVLAIGSFLLASSLASAAWAGLTPPTRATVDRVVPLVRDPADSGGAVRAVIRLGHRRVEVTARGGAGRVLSERLAGERIRVVGTLGPVSPAVRGLLARQHVASELAARDVRYAGAGNPPARLANAVRRTLVRGAESLPPGQRTLFTGFVLGDDRGQSVETVDDFRSSGLSHLLVVSGENVAFVLALAGPLLRRFELGWRLALGLVVLGLFGVLTRWEPSVLRAEAMAAIAMTATALGRPVSTVRLIALAATGLLLLDPLLVRSVGFLLSVGACTGIAVLARPIGEALPGPRFVAQAAGVTLAAQVGVAPVLLPVFGAMPVATIPANLLAVPVAGPVMVWGVAAGIPAGLVGGWPARVLHLPTRLFVGWIAVVARMGASAPLGRVGAIAVLVAGIAGAVALLVPRVRRLAGCCLLVALLLPAATTLVHPPTTAALEIAPGARLWRRGHTTVMVVDHPSATRLLSGLRSHDVRRLDVLAATTGGRTVADAITPVARRLPVGIVMAPAALPGVEGAVVASPGTTARAGPYLVAFTRSSRTPDRIVVTDLERSSGL